MKAFVSLWTNKGKKTWYLVAPSKVTLVFELSTFDDIPVLDTTSGAQILRGADQAGIKWRSTCRVIPIRSSVLISLLLSSGFWSFASAILRKTNENLPWWLRIVDTSSHR